MLKKICDYIANLTKERHRILFAAVFAAILLQCFFVYNEFQNILYENFYFFLNNYILKAKIETETVSRELGSMCLQISDDYSVNSFWNVNQQENLEQKKHEFSEKLHSHNYMNYVEKIYLYNERNKTILSDDGYLYKNIQNELSESDISDILNLPRGETKQSGFRFYPSHHYFYAKNAYFVYYPYSNSGNALLLQLNFSVFEQAYNEIMMLENSSFCIADSAGQLTYSSTALSGAEIQKMLMQIKDGKTRGFVNIQGEKNLFMTSYSAALDQYFIISIPSGKMLHTAAFEKRLQFMVLLVFAFLIILILTAVAAHFSGGEIRRMKGSIKKLYNETVQKSELQWEHQARILFTDSMRCNMNLLKKLGHTFDFENPLYLAMVDISGPDEILHNNEDRELFKYGVINIISECAGEKCQVNGVRMEENEIAFMIFSPDTEPEKIVKLFEVAAGHTKKHLQLDFTVIVSDTVDNYYEIDSVYSEIKHLKAYRYIYGDTFKSSASALFLQNGVGEDIIKQEFKLLDKMLRGGETEKSRELLKQIENEIATLPISTVKIYILLLTNVLCDALNYVAGAGKNDFESYSTVVNAMAAKSISDVWSILDGILREIETCFTAAEKNKYASVCEKIIRLINENYDDSSLGLTFISDKIGMTPNYVSKIFKNYLNVTIPNYTLEVRLKKVAELLENTDMSLEELVTKTGFGSTRYLHIVFKKHFNMSPIVYRKLRRGETEI